MGLQNMDSQPLSKLHFTVNKPVVASVPTLLTRGPICGSDGSLAASEYPVISDLARLLVGTRGPAPEEVYWA